MDKQKYRKVAGDMLYLVACAINGRTPSVSRINGMELAAVYALCEEHSLTAAAAYALEAAGIRNNDFVQAKEKAVRKNIILDADRQAVFQRFEEEKIWYLPLKGVLMKEWYPRLGMRQMTDNDILFDPEKRERVRDIMTELGFSCRHYGLGKDDNYYREPVSNFEMHFELFISGIDNAPAVEYYKNVRERLVRDEDNEYGYHFTDEDYYIYLIAHEYKHFILSGIGVRSLLDIFVYMNRFSDTLDWEYIGNELQKLGIYDFEKQSRNLAMKLFGFEKLSTDEKKLLDYFVTSGTFGTLTHMMERLTSESQTTGAYVWRRIFPPMSIIRTYYPFYYKHKYLLPLLPVQRAAKALSVSRGKVRNELKFLLGKK
ncbi:MAG: nucleotidyltransferase family protein [Ruminococcus sp.]|nr:nucleotidyltransferase family protein [Ruminococcus sp.]